MRVQKKGRRYYAIVRVGGKQIWVATHQTNERKAKQAAAIAVAPFQRDRAARHLASQLCDYVRMLVRREIEEKDLQEVSARMQADLYHEALDCVDRLMSPESTSPQRVWDAYVSSGASVKEATQKVRRQHFDVFTRWAKNKDWRSLTVADCRRFLTSLQCAAQTWNNYVSDLSCVFKASPDVPNPWADESLRVKTAGTHKEAKANPLESIQTLMRFIDAPPQGTRAVMKIPFPEWGAFIRTLYYTGLRPVDAATLTSAEASGELLSLVPDKTSRTGRKISVRIPEPLKRVLASCQPDADGRFFPRLAVLRQRDDAAVIHAFKRLLKLAGLPPDSMTLYGFRHCFVTWQLDHGADADSLAAAVGHSAVSTTMNHYYHGRREVEVSQMPEI